MTKTILSLYNLLFFVEFKVTMFLVFITHCKIKKLLSNYLGLQRMEVLAKTIYTKKPRHRYSTGPKYTFNNNTKERVRFLLNKEEF